ncbi:Protein TIFY 9 [Apostasia shenzhenica]|uniref:Protein TIFY n=1 Tax=Apostasia shenzhenica TaxID=1088818 RepID=A0A2I0AMU9_9ASPA|nr:Protein TIFY 9 [Apostasia shenzhenica]
MFLVPAPILKSSRISWNRRAVSLSLSLSLSLSGTRSTSLPLFLISRRTTRIGRSTVEAMATKATMELDLLGDLQKPSADPMNTIQDMRRSISKINPDLLRSLMSAPAFARPPGMPSEASRTPPLFLPRPLPVLNPASRVDSDCSAGKALMTFFYNGMVTVFNISQGKAKIIMKMVEEENAKANMHGFESGGLLQSLHGDLPLARKKSLLRFLETRKERLAAACPYAGAKHSWPQPRSLEG